MKKHFYIVLSTLIMSTLLLAGCVTDPDIQYDNTAWGNVEALWHIIDEKYCFIEEKGLDWDGVLPVYLEKVDSLKAAEKAANEYAVSNGDKTVSFDMQRELFKLMSRMIDTLKDGHVNLYSSFDVSYCSGWYDAYPANYKGELLTQYFGDDYMTAAGLYYNKMKGHNDIGYIRYTSFQNNFGSLNMYYVLSYFKDCKGIVLDVRQNGGGSLEYAYKLASTFMDTTTLVGYWQHKTGPEHNAFSALEPLYVDSADMPVKWLRPVVILANRRCYSAANTFVNCMRYAPNATIVGGKTGGGGGMPLSYELPNGWMVRLSSVRMTDRDKVSIEEGVSPDIEVTLVSDETDDLIEEAIRLIESEKDKEQSI